MKYYSLVDVNNFYASCERAFQPRLATCPVVVLSNNDGCIIARSDEAKALGIEMGVPYWEVRSLINGLIRTGHLETEGRELIRRV